MTSDEVVHVIAVGNGIVGTVRTVDVSFIMPAARMTGRASVWIRSANRKDVFVYVVLVCVMHVTVMQIVGVAIVAYGGMAAAGAMLMSMIRMFCASAHHDLRE
jgi:hypothetical protein